MPDSAGAETWVRAAARDELKAKGRMVVRPGGGRQIALFETAEGVFACNNRCPHEGYPLSEGTLGQDCRLTCNWHNWAFDLKSGANVYGGDRLRVYPVELRGGEVWIDLAEPPAEARRAEIMAQLRNAFDDRAYARMARELGRLELAGADPLDALRQAVEWTHDRMEFGWTHGFAGAADWLRLRDERAGDGEGRLVCLLEAVAHLAEDTLRQPVYAYAEGEQTFDEAAFLDAVEAADEAAALALLRGALRRGLGFDALQPVFARAALSHYNDFSHALIYTAKAGELIARLGPDAEEPLLLALVRGLVYATREDLIPEFRSYGPALAAWQGAPETVSKSAAPDWQAYRGRDVKRAVALTVEHRRAPPDALFHSLLAANAANMLAYDETYQEHLDRPIQDNVGWLSFTHGLTFANAVRRLCSGTPELWPAGLLQLACFAGRNSGYTTGAPDLARWRVADPEAFFAEALENLLNHDQTEYIVAVHLLKTLLAARDEAAAAAGRPAAELIPAALNRFLHAHIRRKHPRRTARQALAFVQMDG